MNTLDMSKLMWYSDHLTRLGQMWLGSELIPDETRKLLDSKLFKETTLAKDFLMAADIKKLSTEEQSLLNALIDTADVLAKAIDDKMTKAA